MADSSNYRDRPSVTLSDPSGQPLQFNVPAPAMGINPQAIQNLFETQKMEDAEKALSAAIQFQGLRGYQQALKSGEAAEKAMTKYGPMMFYQRPTAVGSAIRSVTPPQMTPFQQATIDERKRKALIPPQMTPYQKAMIDERVAERKRRELLPSPLSLEQKTEAGVAQKNFRDATEELQTTKIVEPNWFRGGNSEKIKAIEKKRDDARIKLQQLGSGFSPIQAPRKSPFPDGQRLKGPGGKIYVVKDGVPVLQ